MTNNVSPRGRFAKISKSWRFGLLGSLLRNPLFDGGPLARSVVIVSSPLGQLRLSSRVLVRHAYLRTFGGLTKFGFAAAARAFAACAVFPEMSLRLKVVFAATDATKSRQFSWTSRETQ